MNKLLIIFGIIVIFICFSGCTDLGSTVTSEEDKFIGTWSTESIYEQLTFYSNERCRKFRYEGTWSIQDDIITITYAAGSKPYSYRYYYYYYYFYNNTMTLKNVDTDISTVYTKL
jgi:hypothetical protein